MKTFDLGEINEPMLIFGGPTSNLHALEALFKLGKGLRIPANRMLSTGDMVAYCADAEATVQRLRGAGVVVLAGNCEKQLAQGSADCNCGFGEDSACSLLSRGWYAHARTQVTDDSREWMGRCPDRIVFRHCGRRFVVIHGGARDINRFIFSVEPEEELAAEMDLLAHQVGSFDAVFAGHSGIAFSRQVGAREWINAGSLGMPQNDGSVQTRYTLLADGKAQTCRLDYDHFGAAKAMRNAKLVQGYHETLVTGYWPSEDVLPMELRV